MNTYIEIHGVRYPATIGGRMNDKNWDGRESKSIQVEMSYADALKIFVNDLKWYIIQDVEKYIEKEDENGEIYFVQEIIKESYDNSEYNLAGDIIDHRNGKITVKMGKPTMEEQLQEMVQIAANSEYQNILAMDDVEVV